MSRMYIVNHWSDAAAYSGEQIGDRLKDSSALHFNRDGSANVNLYSEETALAKRKTSIPLSDRILPQAKRVRVLTEQLIELEAEYKQGLCSVENYSLLRDVLVSKRDRAQVLYLKASSVKPIRNEDEIDEFNGENDYESCAIDYTHATLQGTDKSSFVDQLPHTNIFRKPLEKACKGWKKVLIFQIKIHKYIEDLKNV